MAASSISIKEKIRLLLNLAKDDGASSGEIDNAMRFATMLMAKYHINEDEINKHTDGHERAALYDRMGVGRSYSQTMKLGYWEKLLATFCCQFVGSVQCYISNGKEVVKENGIIKCDSDGNSVIRRAFVFYGVDEDVQLTIDLYNELSVIIAATARMKHGSVMKSSGGDYAQGFVSGLFTRLQNQQLLISQSSESRSLVVQSNEMIELKKSMAKKWLAEQQNIKVRQNKTKRRVKTFDHSAWLNGQSDGKKVELSNNRKLKLT